MRLSDNNEKSGSVKAVRKAPARESIRRNQDVFDNLYQQGYDSDSSIYSVRVFAHHASDASGGGRLRGDCYHAMSC